MQVVNKFAFRLFCEYHSYVLLKRAGVLGRRKESNLSRLLYPGDPLEGEEMHLSWTRPAQNASRA